MHEVDETTPPRTIHRKIQKINEVIQLQAPSEESTLYLMNEWLQTYLGGAVLQEYQEKLKKKQIEQAPEGIFFKI